jgi:D-serine deaminase-like pyridoxal phosphate-dependent protein
MNVLSGCYEELIGRPIADLDTPALLVEATELESNIRTMADLVRGGSSHLRPHCKTHKSATIARMQLAAGATGVCCAKLSEAEAIAARGGVEDIMVTTPVVGRNKVDRLVALARSVKTTVLVDDPGTFEALDHAGARAGRILDVVIEVDVGQGRCGVPPGSPAAGLVDSLQPYRSLNFKGLHGYQGKLQMVRRYQERRSAIRRALDLLEDSAEKIRKSGHDIEILTGGGSGSLPVDLDLGVLNEFQPGSYVFMDSNYRQIEWDSAGNPPPFRSCLTLLGGVVSRPTPERAIVDIGWKAASSDSGSPVPEDPELAFEFAGDEHGIIQRRDGAPLGLALGAKLKLVPSHCDTTVNLHSIYHVVRSGQLEAIWTIEGRGCSR